MGSICSSASNHTGGHTYVSASEQQRRQPQPPRVLDENSTGGPPRGKPDTRAAAAEAAEARLKAAQTRGSNLANPKKGVLSSKLVEANKPKRAPEPREEERIVWD
ncbi:hypothetical protein BS47DRAFT_1349356 [Hydnum rufescens UP504]|uniref:Uncharacterized protein n=1 Tax=Hydnum rufescens UP504 TaxID=1448309 RepID=A0A9P6DNT9_9AGAM|nr:hypothetical protein BS47DRAFT_1349356 [Hydnum rufescens UP504]